ncbi:MAG: hypothetical protein M3R59_07245 [Verrucomicrobiota bacterium]|nr:hypothetical protein [Verrucomicrobiota bacterium]
MALSRKAFRAADLAALRAADAFRPWLSLDDERLCLLCERTFHGRDVLVAEEGREVHCPTPACPSHPDQWVHPGNPLVSEVAYADWWRALGETDAANTTET